MVVRICNSAELDTGLKPSPVGVVFTQFIRVLRDALELTQKCVQFGPVDIVFGEFAMLSRDNVLITVISTDAG